MGRGCITANCRHGQAGKNPTGDPDVDDIVPAPGTERWNITTSTAEAVPHCDVVLSPFLHPSHTISNPIFPTSKQQEELSLKRFQKVPTPLWSLNQRSILASPLKHGYPLWKNLALSLARMSKLHTALNGSILAMLPTVCAKSLA